MQNHAARLLQLYSSDTAHSKCMSTKTQKQQRCCCRCTDTFSRTRHLNLKQSCIESQQRLMLYAQTRCAHIRRNAHNTLTAGCSCRIIQPVLQADKRCMILAPCSHMHHVLAQLAAVADVNLAAVVQLVHKMQCLRASMPPVFPVELMSAD
jgi:hypothetical protein